MKILKVIPYFSPEYGGTVNSTYILSKELSKKGNDVSILTTDINMDKNYIQSIEKYGVNVLSFPSVFNLGLFTYSPSMKKWLDNNIKKFDIIHMHEFRSYQNDIVHRYAKKHNVPYVLQARGSVLPFFQKILLKKIYDHIWGYNILKDAAKIIALTPQEVKEYEMMGVDSDKIEIVPNGIDTTICENIEKGRFREKYKISNDTKLILYLGRIHKIKGVNLLVEAFYKLNKDFEDIKLVLAGPDDGELPQLKKMVKDLQIEKNVIFTGPIYYKDKMEAYKDADVYVLPSFYEAFPNTVLECCCCGTPVVVTNRCGISDFVDEFGYVAQYDKDSLRNAINKVLNNNLSGKKTVQELQKFLKENFDQKKIVSKIENIYIQTE